MNNFDIQAALGYVFWFGVAVYLVAMCLKRFPALADIAKAAYEALARRLISVVDATVGSTLVLLLLTGVALILPFAAQGYGVPVMALLLGLEITTVLLIGPGRVLRLSQALTPQAQHAAVSAAYLLSMLTVLAAPTLLLALAIRLCVSRLPF